MCLATPHPSLQDVASRYPAGLPLLDPVADMGLENDEDLVKAALDISELEAKLATNPGARIVTFSQCHIVTLSHCHILAACVATPRVLLGASSRNKQRRLQDASRLATVQAKLVDGGILHMYLSQSLYGNRLNSRLCSR